MSNNSTHKMFPKFPNGNVGTHITLTCPPSINLKDICHLTQHLIVDNSSIITHTVLSELLDTCPNLTNLACWGDIIPHLVWPSISKLTHLRRLSLANTEQHPGDSDFLSAHLLSAPFSSHLTHLELELVNPSEDSHSHSACQWDPSFLISLPSLTHLTIYFSYANPAFDYKRLGNVLAQCPNLRVFILCSPAQDPDTPEDVYDLYATEHRMVLVDNSLCDFTHWVRCARGGNGSDAWAYAEQVVMMRKGSWFSFFAFMPLLVFC
ncbi:hypothetical protein CVT24_012725 [Panaeolus cyanescens]|uniref:F-box domain-containing protein n=1 Tax=Panaeolus cyanescens TaxID=181874 RepID=A0A409YKX6_9AGAR|nr:hypothetical protein CVT24_012725 [Panaeolus cyanescens]